MLDEEMRQLVVQYLRLSVRLMTKQLAQPVAAPLVTTAPVPAARESAYVPPKRGLRVEAAAPILTPLELLQDKMSAFIVSHPEELSDLVQSLGCGGKCRKCPVPEFLTADEQVRACLSDVVNGLSLDTPL